MKGVVMECNPTTAVVLSNNGDFIKMKNQEYMIGQVVILKDVNKKNKKTLTAIAGLAAAFLFAIAGSAAYFTPVSYISMDVNPSFTYSVNMFKKVLVVKAMNADASALLEDLKVENKSIENAIKKTIDLLIENGYITMDCDSGVLITASNTNAEVAEKLAFRLKENAQTAIDEQGISATVEAQTLTEDKIKEAAALGISPGKLLLIQKLIESADNPDEINVTEWLDRSVKDINNAISEYNSHTDENKVSTTAADTTTQTDASITDETDSGSSITETDDADEKSKTENANKNKSDETESDSDGNSTISEETTETEKEKGKTTKDEAKNTKTTSHTKTNNEDEDEDED